MDRFRSTGSRSLRPGASSLPDARASAGAASAGGLADCDRALEIFSASLDGEAGLEELDHLADHLQGCEPCRRASAALEAQDQWLWGAGPLQKEPPGPLPESPRRWRRVWGGGWRPGRTAAAVAAMAAGIAVAVLVIPWQGGVEPQRGSETSAVAAPGLAEAIQGESSSVVEGPPRRGPGEVGLESAQGVAGGAASELSGREILDRELDLLMARADAVVAALPRSANRAPEIRRWGGGELSRDALSAARQILETLPPGSGPPGSGPPGSDSMGERLFEGSSPARSLRPTLREGWGSGSDAATKNPFRRQRWTSRSS
ncbi:MAG: zf-HC2 domain-containing protein [Acidobacteriota bacterium]